MQKMIKTYNVLKKERMWTFILAGALYLVGVAVILVIKPRFMFTPDGNWKEFGIGQNEVRHTTFPFWLFCIVWAVICYTFVLLVMPRDSEFDSYEEPVRKGRRTREKDSWFKPSKSSFAALGHPAPSPSKPVPPIDSDSDLLFDDEIQEPDMLKKGYYVLNKKASKLAGVPKYVYLGEDQP
jgi:hypothetical protein